MVAIVSGNGLGLSLSSAETLGPRGSLGPASHGQAGERAYVNVATGNLVLQRSDDVLASVGHDIEVLRTYNSRGKLNDDNADNWSVGPYNQPLRLTGTLNTTGSYFTRIGHDGAESVYAYDTSRGHYVSTDGGGAYDTIVHDSAGNQYVWRDGATGATERYDTTAAGRLLSRSDADGNTTSYSYDGSGFLTSVANASGESTHYDYVAGHLVQIRVVLQGGSTAQRVAYGYDANGRLATVTVDLTPGDLTDNKTYLTSYSYDGASTRVASVSQSDGTRLDVSYTEVSAGDWRVAAIADALGQVTQYSYDLANRQTTVTDPLGVASRYAYDTLGQLIAVQTGVTSQKPAGLTQLYYGYDALGNVTSITDAFGSSIRMQYDVNGNLALKQDATGGTVTSTYDALNQLVTQTVSGTTGTTGQGPATTQSLTTRYVYDQGGQLRL